MSTVSDRPEARNIFLFKDFILSGKHTTYLQQKPMNFSAQVHNYYDFIG